jgi:hypothetical protein
MTPHLSFVSIVTPVDLGIVLLTHSVRESTFDDPTFVFSLDSDFFNGNVVRCEEGISQNPSGILNKQSRRTRTPASRNQSYIILLYYTPSRYHKIQSTYIMYGNELGLICYT